MLTRRHFTITAAAMFSQPIASIANAAPTSKKSSWDAWDAKITPAEYDPAMSNPWGLHRRFLPQRVEANTGLNVGDVHVDAVARYLYHIDGAGTAMRYGVAIARGNLYEPGSYTIRRKSKWPTWTPTPAMIKRDPHLYEQHADGMNAGPSNPLGSPRFISTRATAIRICASTAPPARVLLTGVLALVACGWSWRISTGFMTMSQQA